MRRRNSLLALLLTLALASVAPMSAWAQAPAGVLGVVAVAAHAQATADQSSSTQSSTQSGTQSGTQTEVRHESTTSWPVSPLWLAVGGIAVVALIALIVAGSRRDTTTVVK
jgi:lysylphosphatidylglycerol synthetase-like protein (DUF2156 family)